VVVLLPGELLAEGLDVGEELADRVRERELRLGLVEVGYACFRRFELQSLPLLRFKGIQRSVARGFAEPSSRLSPLDQEWSARGPLDPAPLVTGKRAVLPTALALHLLQNIEVDHGRLIDLMG